MGKKVLTPIKDNSSNVKPVSDRLKLHSDCSDSDSPYEHSTPGKRNRYNFDCSVTSSDEDSDTPLRVSAAKRANVSQSQMMHKKAVEEFNQCFQDDTEIEVATSTNAIDRMHRSISRRNMLSGRNSVIADARKNIESRVGKEIPLHPQVQRLNKTKQTSNSERSNGSKAWEHFETLANGNKQCMHCPSRFLKSTATSNLRYHLNNKHGDLFKDDEKKVKEIHLSPEMDIAIPPTPEPEAPISSENESSVMLSPPANNSTGLDSASSPLTSPITMGKWPSANNSTGLYSASSPLTSPITMGKRSSQKSMSSFVGLMPKAIDYSRKTTTGKTMDYFVAKYIIKDLLPLQTVNSKALQDCFDFFGTNYKMPGIVYLYQNLLDPLYETVRTKVHDVLRNQTSMSLSIDCWTSLAQHAYMTFNVTYIDEFFNLNYNVLDTVRLLDGHTSMNQVTKIKEKLAEWELLDKHLFFVTDNASDISNAIQKLGGFFWMGCTAHILNLVVKAGLGESGISKLMSKVKILVPYIKASSKARETLEKMTAWNIVNNLNVIQCQNVRWNTVLDMFVRFVKIYMPIMETISKLDRDDLAITYTEKKEILHAIDLLLPFKEYTEKLSGQTYPTSSLNKLILHKVCNHVSPKSDDTPMICDMKKLMLTNVNKRHTSDFAQETINITSVIDPRYKKYKFNYLDDTHEQLKQRAVDLYILDYPEVLARTEVEQPQNDTPMEMDDNSQTQMDDDSNEIHATEGQTLGECSAFNTESVENKVEWYSKNEEYVDEEDTTSLQDRVNSEFNLYLKHEIPSGTSIQNINPILWWKKNQCVYPLLARVARLYLAVPATSVASERTFSLAGNIVSKHRTRLLPENVNKLVFLNSNRNYFPEGTQFMLDDPELQWPA